MANANKINYDEILKTMQNEIVSVMQEDYEYYKDYKIILSSELQFEKTQDKLPKAIYLVVKFGSATVSFGQSVLPITITAMAEQNKLEVCRRLLSDFAETYNLKRVSDNTIQQILEAPQVVSNFNAVYEGFRSILTMTGVFIVAKNANYFTINDFIIDAEYDDDFYFEDDGSLFLKKKYKELFDDKEHTYTFSVIKSDTGLIYSLDETVIDNIYNLTEPKQNGEYSFVFNVKMYEIPAIASAFGSQADLDTQAFFYKKNFSDSVVRLGTLTFNFTSFLLDDYPIFNTVLDIITKDTDAVPDGVNHTFKMAIVFKNGKVLVDNFKIVSNNAEQKIGEIPIFNATFTN